MCVHMPQHMCKCDVTLCVSELRTHKKSNCFLEMISTTTKFEFEPAHQFQKRPKSFESISARKVTPSVCRQRQPPHSDQKGKEKRQGSALQHFLPTFREMFMHAFAVLPSQPSPCCCSPSGMGEHFKNAATVNKDAHDRHEGKPLIPDTAHNMLFHLTRTKGFKCSCLDVTIQSCRRRSTRFAPFVSADQFFPFLKSCGKVMQF